MTANKREIFLKVGEELFGRYGYKEVGIEDIAREAGMGTGSFYTYFPAKELFYEEILETLESRSIEEIDRLVAGFESPISKLKAVYRFATLGIRKNPILLGILTANHRYIYPGQRERLERGTTLRQHVEKVIDALIQEGEQKRLLRVKGLRNPTALLLAVYDAILMRRDSAGLEELMNDALHLLERGLRRRIRLRPGTRTAPGRRRSQKA
ncbi:MAG: TetR/AcrR family transcriptional regulator [Spirochaetales bacterium]|nr:TetR/AcrR family transcriptional regulator [Spirochaetales bacterium]